MGKILIVDDDAQLRLSFEKILTVEGHKVQMSATGEGGLEIVGTDPPDVVIMDVRLPGMDGLETFKAIHEMDSKLPVIIMTAFTGRRTRLLKLPNWELLITCSSPSTYPRCC